jgi:FG-GAP repeat
MATIFGVKPSHPAVIFLIAVCAVGMLQGCKGRSNKVALPDTPAPVAPVVQAPTAPSLINLSSSTKTLHFSWPAVEGATFYKLYENANGASGFVQVGGNLSGTQYDHAIAVHLFDWPNARFMLEACNAGGCTASSEVTALNLMLPAIGKIQKTTEISFGNNLAISADGNTLAVNSPTVAGVYVYTKSANGWVQQALVQATNPAVNTNAGFGIALALSAEGNMLAVGANMEDGAADNSGATYIFVRTNNSWSQQAYVKASNAEAADEFGNTVALSADGTTLAVGAAVEDSNATGINGNQSNNSAPSSGAVYVYKLQNNNWIQQAYLKSAVAQAGEQFGGESGFGGKVLSLSADGNSLAVGTGSTSSGSVYVFDSTDAGWSQQAIIQSSVANDFFGRSVSLSSDGNTLSVSANTAGGMGAAYVFVRAGANWSQQAYLQASNSEVGDTFGRTLAMSADGNTLVVASYEDSGALGVNGDQNDNSVHDSGAVYVFRRSSNIWEQRAYVKASEVSAHAFFGRIGLAISSNGNTLVSCASANAAVFMY